LKYGGTLGHFIQGNYSRSAAVTAYDVLKVSPGASQVKIKEAYIKLSKEYHPDTAKGGDEDKFRLITDAFDVLADLEKRKAYDEGYLKGCQFRPPPKFSPAMKRNGTPLNTKNKKKSKFVMHNVSGVYNFEDWYQNHNPEFLNMRKNKASSGNFNETFSNKSENISPTLGPRKVTPELFHKVKKRIEYDDAIHATTDNSKVKEMLEKREKERAEYMRREFKEQAEEQDEDQQLRNRGNNFMSGIFGDKSKYTTEFPKYDETVKDTPRPKSKRSPKWSEMYKSKGSGSASDANRDEFDDWTKMEDKKRASTDQVFEDIKNHEVPEGQRLAVQRLAVILLGFAVVVGFMGYSSGNEYDQPTTKKDK